MFSEQFMLGGLVKVKIVVCSLLTTVGVCPCIFVHFFFIYNTYLHLDQKIKKKVKDNFDIVLYVG